MALFAANHEKRCHNGHQKQPYRTESESDLESPGRSFSDLSNERRRSLAETR